MGKYRAILTKKTIQRFEVDIEHNTSDTDDIADRAWLEFNNQEPTLGGEHNCEVEYITVVSKYKRSQ